MYILTLHIFIYMFLKTLFFNNVNFFNILIYRFLLICSILVVFRHVVNVYIVRGMSKVQSLQSQELEQAAFSQADNPGGSCMIDGKGYHYDVHIRFSTICGINTVRNNDFQKIQPNFHLLE